MEAVKEVVKDVRSDVKKLIELLTALNTNLSKLEQFTVVLDKLVKELEEANRNFREVAEVLKLLRELAK
ncbi:MAG: hypothetical protein QXT64_00945 [Desulfurococcaceae archaeon]